MLSFLSFLHLFKICFLSILLFILLFFSFRFKTLFFFSFPFLFFLQRIGNEKLRSSRFYPSLSLSFFFSSSSHSPTHSVVYSECSEHIYITDCSLSLFSFSVFKLFALSRKQKSDNFGCLPIYIHPIIKSPRWCVSLSFFFFLPFPCYIHTVLRRCLPSGLKHWGNFMSR